MVAPIEPEPHDAPEGWRGRIEGHRWHRQSIGMSQAAVFRLEAAGRPALFVKAEADGPFSEIAGEAARLDWMRRQRLPAPEPLAFTRAGDRQWLLMTALPGADLASQSDLPPIEIVSLAAMALARLHATPIGDCPFDHRLPIRLADADARLAAGRVHAETFEPEHANRLPAEMLEELRRTQTADVDLVLTHGDACLPNLMADGPVFTGFVDCGRLGLADRAQDLALAAGSIARNLGESWIAPFFALYGGPRPDAARLRFYRLLDEFF